MKCTYTHSDVLANVTCVRDIVKPVSRDHCHETIAMRDHCKDLLYMGNILVTISTKLMHTYIMQCTGCGTALHIVWVTANVHVLRL